MRTIAESIIQATFVATEDAKAQALRLLKGTPVEVSATPQVEPYMTLKATARALNVHPTTLWRWNVPGHDLGGRRRFRLSEVQAYLESPEFRAHVAKLKEARKAKSKGKGDKS